MFIKKILIWLITVIAIAFIGYGLYYIYLESSAERKAEEAGEKPVQSRQFTFTNSEGRTVIKIEPELQDKFGIKTQPLRSITLTNEIQTFGTVIDISSLITFLTELNTAYINLDLAKREYERTKTLYDAGKNAPYKNVELAAGEVKKMEELIKGLKYKLSLQWGVKIAGIDDLESFLKPFVEGKKTLVKVTLLPGQTISSPPQKARICIIGDERELNEAEFFSAPVSVDAGVITKSFIYSIDGTNLPAGLKLEARLVPPDNSVTSAVFMPESAAVRAFGILWAYKKINEDSFQRFPINETRSLKNGLLTTNGWKEGDIVVTYGAQMLLSEELKSQIRLVE